MGIFGKIKYIILCLVITSPIAFANYNDIYIADIQYDWIKKTLVEKEALISEVHDIIFPNESIMEKRDIKSEFADMKKDKDWKNHYLAASAGYKEIGEFNISAFYANSKKYIYMYALQKKKDLSKNYYYAVNGNLEYVDIIEGGYPDYPYYAFQYRISGKPISAIYYVSKDTQYLFNPDGTFKGVWYKHNLYDDHSKVILKRSQY